MEIFKQSRRDFFKLLSIVFGATSLCGIRALLAAAKEVYPAERITWIVPFKAGGGFDLIARSVAPYLTKYLRELSKEAKGGEIVIKNVPEAGGARAYNNILQAKPNGYTIGDFNSGFFIENVISGHKIDCTKYTYLLRTGVSSRLIVVHTKGFKNWDEMMKAGKEKELKWAAGNFGGGAHVACILVKDTAKVPARLINFPGTAENANALLRGDVHMATLTEISAKAMIDAGEFRVLATLAENSKYLGVPSIAQLGYPELADPLTMTYLIIGPPNLPKEVTDVLIPAFKKVFNDREFLNQAKIIDFEPDPLYGEDAERLSKKLFKYYDEKMPIVRRYLM